MAKINEFRLINISYDYGSIYINDERFHLGGKSSYLYLRNGGGKSVMVQLLTAPFVHKNYRRCGDRMFEDYFTTSEPSFILVEWLLDNGMKLMNGLMVRRNPGDSGSDDILDMYGIIAVYDGDCVQDIRHIPLTEHTNKEMRLKNWTACKQLFDRYKKDADMDFTFYDMNEQRQSRQYFTRLKEYKIDYKEWESIIRKVNEEESGLSDLFKDCKDEKGLLEKWFLDAICRKLDKEGSREKEFQSILNKHVSEYRKNEADIKRRDTILLFKEQILGAYETNNVQSIAGQAGQALNALNEREEQAARISAFYQLLKTLEEEFRNDEERCELKLAETEESIKQTEFESLSYDMLIRSKEKEELAAGLQLIILERDEAERKAEAAARMLGILECRRIQDKRLDEKGLLLRYEEELAASRKEKGEKEPRREELGGLLHFLYQKKLEDCVGAIGRFENENLDKEKECSTKKELAEKTAAEISKGEKESGRLESRIANYDDEETKYNREYGESLSRNILGEYGEAELELLLLSMEKDKDVLAKDMKKQSNEAVKCGEEEEECTHLIEERKNEIQEVQRDISELKKQKDELEVEMNQRRDILKYLRLPEEYLFREEDICTEAYRLRDEGDMEMRRLKMAEEELRERVVSLREGRLTKLETDTQAALEKAGVKAVYGLEWLLKNKKGEKENREIVRRNPFLPYALIMTEKEEEYFRKSAEGVFSAFPLPVINRSSLEKGEIKTDKGMVRFDGVSFFVRFEEDMLNTEYFEKLLMSLEKEADDKASQLLLKKEERDAFSAWAERIKNQKLCGDVYEKNERDIKGAGERLDSLKDELDVLLLRLEEVRKARVEAGKKSERLKEDLSLLERKYRATTELKEEYTSYLDDRKQYDKLMSTLQNKMERKRLVEEAIERLRADISENIGRIAQQRNIEQQLEDKLRKFYRYNKKQPEGEPGQEELLALEAEYEALSREIDVTLKELEERVVEQRKRYDSLSAELEKKAEIHGLREEDWENVFYSEEEEKQQRRNKLESDELLAVKESDYHKTDKKISNLEQKLDDMREDLRRRTGFEEPMSAHMIRVRDYGSELSVMRAEKKALEVEIKDMQRRLGIVAAEAAGISEFSETEPAEGLYTVDDYRDAAYDDLKEYTKALKQEYVRIGNRFERMRNKLQDELNIVANRSEFSEDYYHKPLEAMQRLVGDPAELLRQIDITMRAYDDKIHKIEVDLSLLTREEKEITEELLEYVRCINADLGRLDANSTITVRDRPVKMLKVTVPDWLKYEEMYRLRMSEYVDGVTKTAADKFDKNENLEEYFGTRINARSLFDSVVGLGNVQLRLSKIEKDRELPVSWAEVSKNSGGEGFVSSFVILSSLLYYMRRDDSDIFGERNEGKVLLMDNPFAQTQSEHLLKPLMEIAGKNNTQLIALTGIGNEAIYSRFDNIYVLSIVESGLHSGRRYLQAEHKRGDDPGVMELAHFEVGEQMKLF